MTIVSDRQIQRMNQIKNKMYSIDCILTLSKHLEELKIYYQDILDCKNSDNDKEFLKDIRARIKAIELIQNV